MSRAVSRGGARSKKTSKIIDGEKYITEEEMYAMYLQANTKKAEPLQEQIYGLIRAERRRLIDDEKLALKIKHDIAEPPQPSTEQKEEKKLQQLDLIYHDRQIGLRGTATSPLISAADLGARMGDTNYKRAIRGFSARYLQNLTTDGSPYSDEDSTTVRVPYLTELGAYKYLTQLKLATAAPFQKYVYALAKEERMRTVDPEALQRKIEKSDVNAGRLKSSEPVILAPVVTADGNEDIARTHVTFTRRQEMGAHDMETLKRSERLDAHDELVGADASTADPDSDGWDPEEGH